MHRVDIYRGVKSAARAVWKFCFYLFVPRKAKRLPND